MEMDVTMAYSFQVTFDCADPHVLADWWAEALGWTVEPSDPEFIRRMIAEGHATPADTREHRGALVWKDGAAINHPDDPAGPGGRRILFQLVPEAKTVKNRVHLDIRVGAENVEAEAQRWIERGATFLHRAAQGPHAWITLSDPEGNEVCLA